MPIVISDSLFPIIRQTHRGEATDAHIDDMIAWYDAHFRKNFGRIALLVDCTPVHQSMSPKQRKRVAQWQQDVEERTRALCVCVAIAIGSGLARGALTALFWVKPPPVPHRTFAAVPESFDWLVEKLRAARVEVPAQVLRQRTALTPSV